MKFEDVLLLVKTFEIIGSTPDIRVSISYDGNLYSSLVEMGYRIVLEETAWNLLEMVITKN